MAKRVPVPPCVASMGCLCAGHARGNVATAPCDTSEGPIFDDLPGHVQEDLLAWFNVSEPSAEDKARLATLVAEDRFHAWNCPTCGERVYEGDIEEEEWRGYQGVRQQDFSYFGDSDLYTEETIRRQCDSCRCHPPTHKHDGPPEY